MNRTPTPAPAPPPRLSLAELAARRSPVLSRLLPVREGDRVPVAAFNSGI